MKTATSKTVPTIDTNTNLAIVVSKFNQPVCDGLLKGAQDLLSEAGLPEEKVHIVSVPGAFEIPLAAARLAESKKYAGLICLGAVIRGETPHFDYVCRGVTDGLMRVMLDYHLPVGFGIITTNNEAQALERSNDDEFNKGYETAKTVLEMIKD